MARKFSEANNALNFSALFAGETMRLSEDLDINKSLISQAFAVMAKSLESKDFEPSRAVARMSDSSRISQRRSCLFPQETRCVVGSLTHSKQTDMAILLGSNNLTKGQQAKSWRDCSFRTI